jgi:transcriptional regulator with XRE-family HTH domain
MKTQANVLEKVGPALRWLRERQTRKQYEVAEAAGITKGMLSAYETGRQRPSLDTLEKILGTLGCDLGHLHRALRVMQGDLQEPGSEGRSGEVPEAFRGPWPVEAAAADSNLYSILGLERRLDSEEEAALLQMLQGFHRLLRFFHRSLANPGTGGAAG